MIVSGLLTFVVGNPLLLAALRAGGVLIATPMIGTQTLWSALLAAALLGEALNVRMALAMTLSLAGIVVLTVGKTAQLALQPGWWMAVPLAAGAALCWALGGVLSAGAMRRGINRYQAVFISSLTAVVALNAYLLVSGALPLYWTASLSARLGMLLAGVFNGVALVSLTSAIAQTSVASATTLYSLQIAISPLLAWLVLKEPLNLWMAAGILIITAGVIAVQRART
jgi:drug/metabolite transporter (DMT)-like permease